MQKLYWIVGGLVISGAIAGVSLAVVGQKNHSTGREEPIASITPAPVPLASPIPSPVPTVVAVSPKPSPTAKAIEPVSLEPIAPPKRVVLVDGVKPGSEFFEFRQRLRQAVQGRDVKFVRSLLPSEGITLGFGAVTPIAELKLENPQAEFWGLLEKSIANGCGPGAPSQDPNLPPQTPTWTCSNIAQQLSTQYPASQEKAPEAAGQAVVVGQGVNVRAQPSAKSQIIGTLSDELVEVDHKALTQQSIALAQQGKNYDPINGWTPVILSDQKLGFVANRYVYTPLEYHVVFAKVDGSWRLLYVPGGD